MSRYLWLALLLVPGGSIACGLIYWWRRRQDQPDTKIAELIVPPVVHYPKADEALRERTAAKRATADKIRSRAAKVESGSTSTEILRMVGKR